MEKLYIIIPAYNEEKNIRNVIEDWYPIIEKYNGNGSSRLVVIDDGSKDNTRKTLQELAKERELLQVVSKENGGHGPAVLHGYHLALREDADYIFQTDSDGQTLSSEFDNFWKQRKQYDMLIGWRKDREDGLSRVFVTKVLKAVIKLCFGVTITDANTPFRLMKAETLSSITNLIPDNYNLPNILIAVIYAKKGFRVKYIPITFRPRQGGTNSINIPKIIGIGLEAVKSFYSINKEIKRENKCLKK